MAFTSNRSGSWQIWLADSDGSRPRQLTSLPLASSAAWSPDGTRLVFNGATTARFTDVYIVDAVGGRPVRLTDHPKNEGNPSFSRDGRSGALHLRQERNTSDIFRMNLDGSRQTQITRGAEALWALETFDGQQVIYAAANGDVRSVAVEGGESRTLFRGAPLRYIDVAPDGVYFMADDAHPIQQSRLMFYDFATEATKQVMLLPGEADGVSVARDVPCSTDGSPGGAADLMLVDGFR